jgi:hypothetical protein
MSGYIGSKRSNSLVSATEITLDGAKLKSSGDSITKSDGTTAVLSESGGVVTLNNGTIGSGVVFPAGGTGNAVSIAFIQERHADGTNKGSVAGENKRELNTIYHDPDSLISSVSSSEFTIANAGTYIFEYWCFAYIANVHHAFLRDITAGSTGYLGVGIQSYAYTSAVGNTSYGSAAATISTSNTYALYSYINSADATYGLGVGNVANGVYDVYSQIKVIRVK